MYTGVVEAVGEISRVDRGERGWTVEIESATSDIEPGESFAVDGVCPPAIEVCPDTATVELSGETVERTYLTGLSIGDRVNVERQLPVDGRPDGHVVKETVDATTRVTGIERRADDWLFSFAVPRGMERYVVEKGADL